MENGDAFMRLLEERDRRYEERFDAYNKALELQAKEYERRLEGLNNENARVAQVLSESVTREKYEDGIRAEGEARSAALARNDEKLALMQFAIDELKNTVSRAKGVAVLAAPLLLLAGGVLSKLIGA